MRLLLISRLTSVGHEDNGGARRAVEPVLCQRGEKKESWRFKCSPTVLCLPDGVIYRLNFYSKETPWPWKLYMRMRLHPATVGVAQSERKGEQMGGDMSGSWRRAERDF